MSEAKTTTEVIHTGGVTVHRTKPTSDTVTTQVMTRMRARTSGSPKIARE